MRCDSTNEEHSTRRTTLQSAAAVLAFIALPKQALSAGKASSANVGSYLPKAGEGFVQFKPSETQTPVSQHDRVMLSRSLFGYDG